MRDALSVGEAVVAAGQHETAGRPRAPSEDQPCDQQWLVELHPDHALA